MYDRAESRTLTAAPSPEKREAESGFKERFILAMKSAMTCPELAAMLPKEGEGEVPISVEDIIESEAFKSAFTEMSTLVDKRLEKDKSSVRWLGRERLLRQGALLVSTPVLLRRYIQGVDPSVKPVSKYAMIDMTDAFFGELNQRNCVEDALKKQMETAYRHATELSDHVLVDEANWMIDYYPSTDDTSYSKESHSSDRRRGMAYDKKVVDPEQVKALSAWLVPLLQECKSAFREELKKFPYGAVLDFCEHYDERYGEWPDIGADFSQIESVYNKGRKSFLEDQETYDTHEYLHGEAEDLLRLLSERRKKTADTLFQVEQRVQDARKAIDAWEDIVSEETNKIDQRDVLRYASSEESLKANAVQSDGSPEWIAANQRLEFLNSFPQQVVDEHERRMSDIDGTTQYRDTVVDRHNRSLLRKKKWRGEIVLVDREIDEIRQYNMSAAEAENERYMSAMEAAEKAEKDLVTLPLELEKLDKRVKRYWEAIDAQKEVVAEEAHIMQEWQAIYLRSTHSNVPPPGFYADQADRMARGY